MKLTPFDTPNDAGVTSNPEVPQTLPEAISYYSNLDVATMALSLARWRNGIECPRCHSKARHFYLSTRRIWKCKSCRQQFSPKAGTIFEDSPLGLDTWLTALWILANSEQGTSSYRLSRELGVTQTTAQFMLRRIRLAMHTPEFVDSADQHKALAISA